MTNMVAEFTTPEGVNYRIGFKASHNVGSGLGCQAAVHTGLGYIAIEGISRTEKGKKAVISGRPPTAPGAFDNPYERVSGVNVLTHLDNKLFPDLTHKMVLDACWETLTRSLNVYGVHVFSDRVNRGSGMSPGKILNNFFPHPTTPAAFAKWLSGRPDLGTLFSGPIFHNPNHSRSVDFSLCQVFQFIPPKGTEYLLVDEANAGVGPDTAEYPKERFLNTWGKAFGVKEPEKQFGITYDGV